MQWRRFEGFTKKQMGDAGEMLVAAELTLHGIPARTASVSESWTNEGKTQ